jgi:hypothetical protein
MILGALSAAGGQKYLEQQAKANPTAFLTLLGKVLPLQVSGEGGGPMVIKLIKYGRGAGDWRSFALARRRRMYSR